MHEAKKLFQLDSQRELDLGVQVDHVGPVVLGDHDLPKNNTTEH